MIELPEAINIAGQLNHTVRGKRIARVTVAHTPHKLAWYYGEPPTYPNLLVGGTVGEASPFGSMVEIKADNANILFGEGVGIRFHDRNTSYPAKHQLLLEFDDHSAVSASIQMYGGLGAFLSGELDNYYYKVSREKPSPLSPEFDRAYFGGMINQDAVQKLLKGLSGNGTENPGTRQRHLAGYPVQREDAPEEKGQYAFRRR